MASYVEDFNSKLDLAMPFQRTGKFPLDRTDVFASYADAVKYAKGDVMDPDSRGLLGTSYIGQIITVYENDTVTVYKINPDRTLSSVGGGGGSVTPDGRTIVYNSKDELSLNGYDAAKQGQILVKDTTKGLAWVNPVSTEQLDAAVAAATAQATQAGVYATLAGNSASAANTSAQAALRINEQTMLWVNNKFWWGTEAEYNELEEINEGTFYFVQLA